jgi:hypothetical protein
MAKIGDTERSDKIQKTAEFKRRFYDLALSTVRFIDGLPNDAVSKRIADQLLRSATSVVANYVEGQSAGTRKDFANFLTMALNRPMKARSGLHCCGIVNEPIGRRSILFCGNWMRLDESSGPVLLPCGASKE